MSAVPDPAPDDWLAWGVVLKEALASGGLGGPVARPSATALPAAAAAGKEEVPAAAA